ncbi:hypothetical protein AV530_011136 [Patagioenas fasciata monilis]|uniref:Uncharacterized protein n=1 Tax=Patagioenas fasciata monilis TaxID=372326 RepID=A0A1V4KCK9_PATFA|nr:hypothetical protein AV530_011136 [Patagioenas fasciata monilis]
MEVYIPSFRYEESELERGYTITLSLILLNLIMWGLTVKSHGVGRYCDKTSVLQGVKDFVLSRYFTTSVLPESD